MGLHRPRPCSSRPERVPFLVRHARRSRPGSTTMPLGSRATRAEQRGHGRRGGGDAGGDDEAGGRRRPPALGDRAEQPVAAVGEVDPPALGEQCRPVVEDQLAAGRATSASGAKARAASAAKLAQARAGRPPRSAAGRACAPDPRRAAAPRPRRSPSCAGRARRAASAARAARSPAAPARRRPSGSSVPPIRSSSSGSPTGTSRGSSKPPPRRRTNASVIARAARLLGTRIRPRASADRVRAEARDQPGGERVGEGAVGRDGEDRGLHRRPPSDMLQRRFRLADRLRACRCRTTGPGGPRRSSGPPRSPGPTGCWSRTGPPGVVANSRLETHLDAGEDERRDVRSVSRRRSAPGAVHVEIADARLWLSARACGTSSSSASIRASSHCEASSLSVSTGPSIQRLSLLTRGTDRQSISGSARTRPPPVSISRSRSSEITTSRPSIAAREMSFERVGEIMDVDHGLLARPPRAAGRGT